MKPFSKNVPAHAILANLRSLPAIGFRILIVSRNFVVCVWYFQIVRTALDRFLKSHGDFVEEVVQWGPLQFTVRSFLCSEKPPIEFVTSVKADVLHQGKILVVQDPESVHIIRGGRCEPDELWEDTLRREIAEETGWRLGKISMLGVRCFHS